MITSFNCETKDELEWLASHEDRSGSKIINRLIKKEYEKCRKKQKS